MLVKPIGLPGVAMGTLIPVVPRVHPVLFPAGCRRVRAAALACARRSGVADAVAGRGDDAFVLATRDLIPATLVAVARRLAAAVRRLRVVFVFFGISTVERQLYLEKVNELLHRRRRPSSRRVGGRMRGVILAAGRGSPERRDRRRPNAWRRSAARRCSSARSSRCARAASSDIVVVVGCQADDVRARLRRRIDLVDNARYAQTNSLYSLWLARTSAM